MKRDQIPISQMLHKIARLGKAHQAAYLRGHIASEQEGNPHRTSVRIREMQAALRDVVTKQLRRESRVA